MDVGDSGRDESARGDAELSGLKVSAIGDCVLPVKTWNPLKSPSEAEFLYIDLSAIDQDRKTITEARSLACADAPSRARQLVEAGDVLVSTVRPNLNGVARARREHHGATASTGFCVLRPAVAKLDSAYAFQWVKSPNFVNAMVGMATGASYPGVSDRIIFESKIPLPPLPEQRRIAAILDQADALRAKRREALAQLDSLTQSIFIEMFGGATTDQLGWPKISLSEVADVLTGYAFKSDEYVESGKSKVRLCRGANVMPGRVDWQDLACWPNAGSDKLSAFGLEAGDIVMAMDRPWIAEGFKIARIAPSDCPALLVQRVARVRATEIALDDFLYGLLSQREFAQHCRPTETTIPHISPKEIRSFEFRLPPLALQQTFATRIQAVESLKATHRAALAELDALFASLQHRAFAGQLS